MAAFNYLLLHFPSWRVPNLNYFVTSLDMCWIFCKVFWLQQWKRVKFILILKFIYTREVGTVRLSHHKIISIALIIFFFSFPYGKVPQLKKFWMKVCGDLQISQEAWGTKIWEYPSVSVLWGMWNIWGDPLANHVIRL